MILRYLSTGVYWITFLYFINYTIDILIEIEKECRKKKMDNFTRIKCFLTNVKLLVGGLCCIMSYYLAYYSPKFTKGSIADTVVTGIERQIEKMSK
tara:strand:+ start:1814 stop:2101 length:288 start_codon:yes stop_codon:yes gene_type:complete